MGGTVALVLPEFEKTALAYSKSSTTAQNPFCKIHILVW